MQKTLMCLRCNSKMKYLGKNKIQLGQESFFFGSWFNLINGALEVGIYLCPNCGKYEFFQFGSDTVPEDTFDPEVE